MTVRQCIKAKVAAGRIRPRDAAEALDMFDDLLESRKSQAGAQHAETDAALKLDRLMRQKADDLQYQAVLQIMIDKRNLDTVSRHPKGVKNGGLSLLETDIYDDLADVDNVAQVEAGLRGRAHGVLFDAIERFRLKGIEIRADIDGQAEWLRGIFGRAGGDERPVTKEAGAFAELWEKATALLEAEFKRGGGRLPEGDRRIYFPNPSHDQTAISNVSRETWVNYTRERLDRSRMVDYRTGEPLNDFDLQALLEDVYETLSTGGLNKLDGSGRRRKAVANRMEYARVLQFKSADAWLDYNARFGNGDVYMTLMGHIDRLARDTALIQVLGPNPDAAARRFRDLIQQEGGRNATAGARHFEKTYQILSGQDQPVGKGEFANWSASVRAWLTGQQLGSAMLTAVSDFGFMTQTSLWNGLPATRAMSHYLSLMNPADNSARRAAAEMGLAVENALSAAHASFRHVDSMGASRFAGRYADWIMRASGLSPHTQAGRAAMGMTVMGEMADHAGKAFTALPRSFRDMLETYGMTAKDWDIVRQAEAYDFRGGRFLSPNDIMATGADGARRVAGILQRAIQSQMNRGVPASTARIDALLSGFTDRGTVAGEAARFLGMYKRFPALIIHAHLAPLFSGRLDKWTTASGAWARGRYIAGLIGFTGVMGGMALQLNEIANGRDPRDMTTPEFWSASVMKGGAMGFFADFLYGAAQNSYGRGPVEAAAGPAVGLLSDTLRLTAGNIGQAVRGENTLIGREAVQFFDRYLMPGTSLWQSKLAMERLITDQLTMLADPHHARRFRAVEGYARERGQEYWWRPGRAAPDRAPNLQEIAP